MPSPPLEKPRSRWPLAGQPPTRVLVFVPMYNCAAQIGRVLARLDERWRGLVHRVLVIDNGSRDGGRDAAVEALRRLPVPGRLVQNVENVNLGGSHKVAFDHALAHGFSHVLVLHGDDQADATDLRPYLEQGDCLGLDCFLGSRFSLGSRRSGYSTFRTIGNFGYNGLFSLATRRLLVDLGSGLNLFAVGWLQDRCYLRFADDLTFNYQLILHIVERRARFRFFPISWREEDQVSNVRLLRQALRTLGILGGYVQGGERYLARRHTHRSAGDYRATQLFANAVEDA